MKKIIELRGGDALIVSSSVMRLPEVKTWDSTWREEPLWRGRVVAVEAPEDVRLRGSARLLVETITRQSVPLDADVAEFIDRVAPSLTPAQQEAIALIRAAL